MCQAGSLRDAGQIARSSRLKPPRGQQDEKNRGQHLIQRRSNSFRAGMRVSLDGALGQQLERVPYPGFV